MKVKNNQAYFTPAGKDLYFRQRKCTSCNVAISWALWKTLRDSDYTIKIVIILAQLRNTLRLARCVPAMTMMSSYALGSCLAIYNNCVEAHHNTQTNKLCTCKQLAKEVCQLLSLDLTWQETNLKCLIRLC